MGTPVLRGQKPADWRTAFYYQYYEYPTPHRVRPHYGVVTDRYKLVHFFGTATLSFSEGFQTQVGDVFEIESPTFGLPLRNTLAAARKGSGFTPIRTL